MKRFDVFGVSDWSETDGELFAIFTAKEFASEDAARQAAANAYGPDLELIINEVES